MIHLIGGSPRCGKTGLSTLLKNKYNIPCIHLDELAQMYFDSLSTLEQKKIYPLFSLENGNTARFDKYSIQENIKLELNEGINLYKIILNIISNNTFNYKDYIIEGVQMTPNLVSEIIGKNPNKTFSSSFLIKEYYQFVKLYNFNLLYLGNIF